MKLRGWMVAALLLGGGLVFANRGCLNQKAADEKLADHFDDLCDIARANVDSPRAGVHALGRYFGKHGGDMLGELGDTLATIERISDDEDHDARAELARDRLREPLVACAREWNDFADAIDNDPDATHDLQYGLDRLGRTLEILLQSQALDLHALPGQILHAVDTTRR